MEAFEFFEVPPYLIRVILSYLSNRWVGTPVGMKTDGDPSSAVFRRVLFWERFCGSSATTRCFAVSWLRTQAWCLTLTTRCSWPGDVGGTRHCVTTSSSSFARYVPYAGWAWGCPQPSRRLSGFMTGGVGGLLCPTCVWI